MGLGFRVEALMGLRFGFGGSAVERDKIRSATRFGSIVGLLATRMPLQ